MSIHQTISGGKDPLTDTPIYLRLDQSEKDGLFIRLDMPSIVAAGPDVIREMAKNFNDLKNGSAQLKMDKGKPVAFFSMEIAEFIYGNDMMKGFEHDLTFNGRGNRTDVQVTDLTLQDMDRRNFEMNKAGIDPSDYERLSWGSYDRLVHGQRASLERDAPVASPDAVVKGSTVAEGSGVVQSLQSRVREQPAPDNRQVEGPDGVENVDPDEPDDPFSRDMDSGPNMN